MVIIAAPVFDIPTTISSLAAKIVYDAAKEKGFKATLLSGLFANSASLLFIEDNAFFYYGHGTENSLIGEFLFTPMLSPINVNWTRDKIIYTMACLSALELGPLAIQNGCKCYMGAITEMYAAFPAPERNYMEDWLYLQTIIPLSLLNGYTTGEAYSKYVKESFHYAKIYEDGYKNHTLPNGDYYAVTTKSNAENYILIGNDNLRLV